MFLYFGKVIKIPSAWGCGRSSTRTIATAVKHVKKGKSSRSKIDKHKTSILKRRALQGEEETNKGHIFKLMYPWKTKLQLAEHLKSTEVYNSGGLIALCKPYGIAQVRGVSSDSGPQTVVQILNSGGIPDHVPTVGATIPVLKELYGASHLEVIRSAERWSSGLMLLCTSPELADKVHKSLRRSRTLQQPPLTYWAVTVSLPQPVSAASKAACKLEYVNNIGKVPVILKNYTQASLKRGEVKLSVVEHQTLIYNKNTGAALVEVNTHSARWHFLRVWLAHSFSPILGDALYSSRVKMIAGKKLHVSPHNLTSYEPQMIPEELYSKLELPSQAKDMIPCHLHLAKVRLAQFNNDKSDLIISAQPPDFFMWTCRQLGLMSSEDSAAETNCDSTQGKENAGPPPP
ncbi:mitochondrial mRNA pseudouridine synthase RPUSD3 [Procambarus clarkii]|uniref:mitochondrial mRNA pseudouridine synthase RPUSD3 n=1 Tax=Procambarus clarkii TaxID=6728 RepID=UPI001E67851D|nr:mitochondrial mRNA pseudouridine synthase RPUSD3-like [Procambarus clarkii]XP_045605803.1 mitochondrial mRNA pseudouridine synthase RPUSD3-like [Procambarus clarkii]